MEQNFDPLKEAQRIKQSICKPKDMNKLINVITFHSNFQRQQILNSYNTHYNSNLINDLKQELNGNFLNAVIALFYTPVDYDCYHLNKALKDLNTNKDTLIEILSTRSNQRISEIKIRFPKMFEGKDLVKVINIIISGFFKKILLKLLEGRPDNQHPNENECEECAKKLFEAENAKKDVIQETYINIFTQKSKDEFVLITQKYYKLYNKTILETIEKIFSGDVRKIFKAITYALLSPSEYFAYRINKALKSFLTTNDLVLIRVLVSRDEIDIERIKRYYLQIYNIDLYNEIKKVINGDYKNLLLSLIGQ